MDKLGLGLDDDIQQDPAQKDPREQRKASIQRCIQFLVHASQCRDPMCKQPSCIKMKRVLRHTRDCKVRMSGNCTICKQFLLLCYSHAKRCTDDKCPVPICARIKKNLREQRAQSNMRQNTQQHKDHEQGEFQPVRACSCSLTYSSEFYSILTCTLDIPNILPNS